jgi:hypothetical protein
VHAQPVTRKVVEQSDICVIMCPVNTLQLPPHPPLNCR